MATLTDLKKTISEKKGFVRIVKDELTKDNIAEDSIEKRVMTVETSNSDGSAGMTPVYYILDKQSQEAKFYNIEPESFDNRELSREAKREDALAKYLGGKYEAYFIDRIDRANSWAEATVYSLSEGKLIKKNVIVYKKGATPITDIDVA